MRSLVRFQVAPPSLISTNTWCRARRCSRSRGSGSHRGVKPIARDAPHGEDTRHGVTVGRLRSDPAPRRPSQHRRPLAGRRPSGGRSRSATSTLTGCSFRRGRMLRAPSRSPPTNWSGPPERRQLLQQRPTTVGLHWARSVHRRPRVGDHSRDLRWINYVPGTLRGNSLPGAPAPTRDTAAAYGWFRPTVPVLAMDFTFGPRAGAPSYQLWLAAPAPKAVITAPSSSPTSRRARRSRRRQPRPSTAPTAPRF
jgi:hypothetical protein